MFGMGGNFNKGMRGEVPTLRQPIHHTLRRLWLYAYPYKKQMSLSLLCILLISGLNLVIPQLTRTVIDKVIPQKHYDLIWIIMGVILLTTVVNGMCSFFRNCLMSQVGQGVIFDLRNKLYEHIQDLSHTFFDNRRTGELMSRVTNDVGSVQGLISSGVIEIIADFLTFGVIFVVLWMADWRLTCLVLITFPPMVMTTRKFSKHIRKAYKSVQESIASVNEHLQDTLSSIRVVKSFANERHEVSRFSKHNEKSRDANLGAVRLWSIYGPIMDIFNQMGTIVVLGYGAHEVITGRISLGTLVAFMAYIKILQMPVTRFSRILNVIQQASASAERIFEILDTVPDIRDKDTAVPLPVKEATIKYHDVCFSYNKQNVVLHKFSLTIEPGMNVALVGPSGAGKTTVINLLARFYDPDSGHISIGGFDLRDVTLHSLRNQFGIVSQEILLLNGNLEENIAYGRPGATRKEVEAAARYANAHDFILGFPEGYETQIGERGIKLSGGQRQRVAIARAILKNPQIIIFDEATSQLDSESEAVIQEVMVKLLKNRTSIVIAHRLSTVQRADMIVVMNNGRIVETGKHDELLALGGLYSTLYAIQFRTSIEENAVA
jgi:subfamily B ATP-binding cassette protein MsbA